MEVTNQNFEEALPLVMNAVSACSFVAMDLELTGLHTGSVDAIDMLDDSQERYSKLADSARSFLPIQFGLSCFVWSDELSGYVTYYDYTMQLDGVSER